MSESDSEQNKTEEATPFKLKKAREKGNVAKGSDLAFFGTMVALCIYAVAFLPQGLTNMAMMMRRALRGAIQDSRNPNLAVESIQAFYWPGLATVATLGIFVFCLILLMQVLQIGGLLFTAHPLKPDFNRMNPAKGLKKIFSLRTLKEALKNIIKMAVYLGCTYLLIRYCLEVFANTLTNTDRVILAFQGAGLRLLFMYTLLSIFFAAIDQVIVRKEFSKQMRMSTSEVKRETKDREGEPRQKQKRKQVHSELSKQSASMGDLAGSDIIIVNPEHFAVALKYNAEETDAPVISTKGRNLIAESIKDRAFILGIPILSDPPLARALFKSGKIGKEIPGEHFQKVADVYLKLYKDRQS